MAIEKMTLVQITGDVSKLDDVLIKCSDNGHFHPERPAQPGENATGYRQIEEENPYKARLARVTDVGINAGIRLDYDPNWKKEFAPEDIDLFLEEFRGDLVRLSDEKNRLTTSIEQKESALTQLAHLDTLDVSLDDLFACSYIKVRVGRLPTDSYEKLSYYKNRMFFFRSLSEENNYHWGIYFTTPDHKAEVDDIFSSLYFERVHVPEYVHGTPGTAKRLFEEELAADKHKLSGIQAQLNQLVKENQPQFLTVYSCLKFLDESFDLRKYVTAYQREFHLIGFLPKRDEEAFAESFAKISGVSVEFKPHDSDKRLITPTRLKNNRLFQPFEMFVDMYGTPSYNEIDPTPFLGLTYTLLFGIMFGDVGQGLVIALVGFLWWKIKKTDFGRILIRIGFSAALFGLVYGSVFGLEHLLDPFYTGVLGLPSKPVEVLDALTINNLLIVALALGVVLIIVSMTINIVIGVKNRDWEKAVFSNNGLAGMVFYVSILLGAVSMLTGGPNLFTLPYILGFIVLPILVIFLKHPLGEASKRRRVQLEGGIGGFILEGIFELLEVVLSFVTNTMSFLRVGGFIISHAGMMAVVLTLTEMFTGTGSVVTLVIGNAFVICLEGFIVGIQSLRLEFYEMFSRYFDGQGKAFAPIVISPSKGA